MATLEREAVVCGGSTVFYITTLQRKITLGTCRTNCHNPPYGKRWRLYILPTESLAHTESYTSFGEILPCNSKIVYASAPEEVKRVFSLQNASQWEHRRIALEKAEDKYADKFEQKIAKLTVQIEAVKTNNNDGRKGKKDMKNKVFLSWLIAQRRKKLQNLKDHRFERYLELLKELDIAPLESPHSKWNKYKFRQFKMGVEIKEKKRPYLRRV